MTEEIYTIIFGKNNEFKEIIDHSKQDKHMSMLEFLKQVNKQDKAFKELEKENKKLKKENEHLKQQKPFLKIIDDYFIQYEDGEFFNLHKPSNIRSLMHILNREHGYSELQCEYNDLEKGDVE